MIYMLMYCYIASDTMGDYLGSIDALNAEGVDKEAWYTPEHIE